MTGGKNISGAALLCRVLEALGTRHIFGLPGTQNVVLYEALRHSTITSVHASDELGAAFMANGYARATGRLGVLTTIPGPGVTYAVTGAMEALHDSAPLLWITLRSKDSGRAFQLQQFDLAALAKESVKTCYSVESAAELPKTIFEAARTALGEEPGPVFVAIARDVLADELTSAGELSVPPSPPVPEMTEQQREELRRLLSSRGRITILAGQGAAAAETKELAELLNAPVIPTSSGRGAISDEHPNLICADFSFGPGTTAPQVFAGSDLILALGCKLTHNGSAGFGLKLPKEKLVRIDTSARVLAANYESNLPLHLPAEIAVREILSLARDSRSSAQSWSQDEIAGFRRDAGAERASAVSCEPRLSGCRPDAFAALFSSLAHALPENSIIVTDTGLHQSLTRIYATVRRPRGLICPADFQSMGFGVPAAIGAKLAVPAAEVVACVGDGSFLLTATELLTAVREQLDLLVVVFNDASLGQIRRQQLFDYGKSKNVELLNPDFGALAQALGCGYYLLRGEVSGVVSQAVEARGVRLLELPLRDSRELRIVTARAASRSVIRRVAPERVRRILGSLRRIVKHK